ncbi:MAG: YceI family protein [Herminiimonas sp.]|nr:YceI family protein [Herminiimonas sp.]
MQQQGWFRCAQQHLFAVLWIPLAAALLLPGAGWAGERYRIDPQHTFSSFEYEHWGLSLQRGRFDGNTGVIDFDVQAKTGAIDIQIDAASISTGSSLFDRVLRSTEFFDVAKYPGIDFKSSVLRFEGERLTQVDGILTIKGISRTVTLQMTRFDCRFMVLYGKRACGANGYAKLSRSEFELGRYVPFVSDLVTLYVSVEAIRDEPAAASPAQ